MDDQTRRAAMQVAWHQLLRPFDPAPQLAGQSFADLAAHYQADGRFYHTLEHIDNVLRMVERLSRYAQNLVAIQLAAWFHDVIYDPGAADNEEKSATYAIRTLADLNVPESTTASVHQLILATKHHVAAASDIDAHILLDADLATLAANWEQFDHYSQAIRQEYAQVPDPAYQQARVRFLQQFLQRPRIFHTDQMFMALEQRARRNIEREITNLMSRE